MKAILIVLTLVSATLAQDKRPVTSPTVAQCRAYYTQWSDNPIADLKNVPLSALAFRSSQMGKCATVDSEWEKAFNRTYAEGKNDAPVDYRALEAIFLGAQGIRAAHFIERHHLMDQYLKEDEEKIGR